MAEIKGSFFNQIVKTARTTADTVGKKTGEIFENTKNKIAIADIQNDIEAVYVEIGKLVYQAFADGTEPSSEINDKCALISEKLNEIEALKDKIETDQPKSDAFCPNCGVAVDADGNFCASCGAKLK